jgi:type 1 glutamine amidotransferase
MRCFFNSFPAVESSDIGLSICVTASLFAARFASYCRSFLRDWLRAVTALGRPQVENLRYSRLKICATASVLAAIFASVCVSAAEPTSGSAVLTNQARVLIVTGIDYPGHHWRETAPVLAQALRRDERLEVFTAEDPNFLDSAALQRYDVVVLHFQNWQQAGPGERARENLRQFVNSGKGLALVHFACGAWHGEWPEFEKLAGRVWFGSEPGPGKHQHDPYGPFHVDLVRPEHPIVRGMADFDTQDELYTCLIGNTPIEVVAQAKSKVDNQFYPMAFVARYGQGRTFHCVLGHDAKALSIPSVQELYRRGCAWAAGLAPSASEGGHQPPKP